MLSRIKITFLDMKHGIETGKMDDLQLLSSILANVPTAEDEVALQDFIGGSPEKLAVLDRADQFLAMLIPIPRLKSRLEAMIFALKLKERLTETTPQVDAIAAACRDLKSSMALKKTLRIVLQVGNFMNSGSFRGNAQGFNIDFLMRLGDIKANGSKQTLLHYLASVLKADVQTLESDLASLDKAARVSLVTLQQDVRELVSGFRAIEAELPHHDAASPFTTMMAQFVAAHKDEVNSLAAALDQVQTDFAGVVTAFGDDPTTATPESFFGLFKGFVAAVGKAQREIIAMARKASTTSVASSAAVTAAAAKAAIAENRKGVADELLSSLQTGDAFKKRRGGAVRP
ncbi:hypothetical protein AMAG_17661 [Allomyces macrogynus ATCC 38327]|uniref:FH2 domain-containing protein n=1 Tax=Allomyces macrogynus (strain ATCC 38327) TaxID=578462 RepID=A0A0L0RW57_ALLM3|nr:hypothetical protein AMAG_17661 [Allomyces macrogynus ATCC 38327]|eukprot:KNE54374.1 hypothetical protein AMAG_17661 [Allomyces macrogynus ATCC 38327]